ncbi:aspartate-semialdehyde dehydrogenase [Pseudomonas sp. gcc21]|uniref:aspartate-semialdehyde dehydrogenase n=1 Tax=Pseudomonas sp. gcc21 TaxID=2726989 RepID=UPI0014515EAE|nr:aspartate-semialdehyde dehydrogenase [Pseudomonas sp. gcc21]QJD58095.1 aspartate-semialdehyde dehydrogenase [Pseudomonas sp. gcc21]
MTKSCDVAIVGVYGIVGESVMSLLEDHAFPFATVHLLETREAAGGRLMVHGQSQRVEIVEQFDFSQVQLVLFVSDMELAAEWAPKAVQAGCAVVDATGAFRDADIPLVVAEVNPESLSGFAARRIVACPDSEVAQAAVALKPLRDEVGLLSVNIATYQSMSTQGKEQVEALALQTGRLLNGQPAERGAFEKQAAFNLIPRIGEIDENGDSQSELRLADDLRRVLDMPKLPVSATCVLVPIFFGTAQAVQARTEQVIAEKRLGTLMRKAKGVKLLDKPAEGGYPTPVSDATGSDHVWISRLRQDRLEPQSVNLWAVSDNLRKGVALNSLEVAGLLIKDFL